MSGLPIDYQYLTRRLENWGRWARGSAGPASMRCCSAERRYRRAALDADVQVRQCDVPTDDADAMAVEAAVLALEDRGARQLMRLYFVHQRPWYIVGRDVGLRDRTRVLGLIASVVVMVGEELRQQRPKLIKRGRRIWAGCKA